MKLIIDISEEIYQEAVESGYSYQYDEVVANAVAEGIPLDVVKTEIAEEICLTDNPYTKETKYTIEYSKLLELLDNIGKAESE